MFPVGYEYNYTDCTATTLAGGGYPGSTMLSRSYTCPMALACSYPSSTQSGFGYAGSTMLSNNFTCPTTLNNRYTYPTPFSTSYLGSGQPGYAGSTMLSNSYTYGPTITSTYPSLTQSGVGNAGSTMLSNSNTCQPTLSSSYPSLTQSGVSTAGSMVLSNSYICPPTLSSSYPSLTQSGVSNAGSMAQSNSYTNSTNLSGSNLGSSLSAVSYGSTMFRAGYDGSTPLESGYPGLTSVGNGYPGSTSLGESAVTTRMTDGTLTTSLGDTRVINQLLGMEDQEEYQDEYQEQNEGGNKSTVPLPDELIQMFQRQECKLCDVLLKSELTAYIHYEGKYHQKAVAAYMMDQYSVKGSLRKHRNRFLPVFCEVCKTTLTSRIVCDTHFAGKTHAKNLRKFEYRAAEPVMEDDVDFAFQPPPPPPPPKLSDFLCEVCRVPANSEYQLIMHKEGSKHKKKLMAIEQQAGAENDEYYDEMEDEEFPNDTEDNICGEEQNSGEFHRGPVEHVEDPTMDQPLQFNSETGAISGKAVDDKRNSDEETADGPDAEETEDSTLWDFVLEMMDSDATKRADGRTQGLHLSREETTAKEKEDNAGSQSHQPEMDAKVNPGAASTLHKYKCALKAQKGEMIKTVIPAEKSTIIKESSPKIRSKVNEKEESNRDRCSDVFDFMESLSKPYYNPNVDFHRRKSPSPEDLDIGREERKWKRYGSYGWGTVGHSREGKMSGCHRGDTWGRDFGRKRVECDPKSNWYRGRLPQENQYSSSSSRKRRYGGDGDSQDETNRGRHSSRIMSRIGWNHDGERQREAADSSNWRESLIGESSVSSSGRSRTTSTSSSARNIQTADKSSFDEDSPNTDSPKRVSCGRSRKVRKRRSHSRCYEGVQKFRPDSESSRMQATSSQKRKQRESKYSCGNERKRKKTHE